MDKGILSYRRYLDGDDEGLVELMRDYEDGLILYINSIVCNMDTAKELSEDTFFKLALKKPRYHEKCSFKAWLYAIGRNTAVSYIRREMLRRKSVCIDVEGDIEAPDDLEREHIKSEEKLMLHNAVKKLKSDHRQVLELVYFEELSHSEAAAVMHKSVRQVENLLYRARKALKTELEREGFVYEEL